MLFNRALVSSLLFASAVLAVSQHRQASFLDIVEESVNGGSAAYSRNWAGALLEKTPVSVNLVNCVFLYLIWSCSDRELSKLLRAPSSSLVPLVNMALVPPFGLVSTVTNAKPIFFRRGSPYTRVKALSTRVNSY